MARSEKVFAVVPIHNGVDRTLACLRSLASGTFVPHTVVVDDGSTDGSKAAISREFPDVEILQGDGNLWWSGAMNLGVRHALSSGADFVLSLNNDCVLDRTAVEALVDCATEDRRAIVGSKIRYLGKPQTILCVGGSLHWGRDLLWYHGANEIDNGQLDQRREVDWVPGMSALIPAAAFKTAGLYDDRRFPMSWGDIDFILRAKARGWKTVVEPGSLVWNDQEQTSPDADYRIDFSHALRLLTDIKSRWRFTAALQFFLRHGRLGQLPAVLYGYYAPMGRGLRRRYLTPAKARIKGLSPR